MSTDFISMADKMEIELEQHQENDEEKKFVHPWMGIVANLPLEKKETRYVGKSGSRLKEDLVSKGFNPMKVHPLWNYSGFSGYAVVEFTNDWHGFTNATMFDKSFAKDHQGKSHYLGSTHDKGDHKLYGWVAKADDFNSVGIVAEYLQKHGDLKSVSEVEAEEKGKTHSLVANLSNRIEAKNRRLKEIEAKCAETSMCLYNVMNQRDAMIQDYNEDLQRMAKNARDQLEKVLNAQEKSNSILEAQRKELELHEKDLTAREALNDHQRYNLHMLKQMNERATTEQKRADESVLKLAEEQQKEKDALHKKIMELQKELDSRQALELEIQRLRGAMQVMSHMGDGQDVMKKLDEIKESLKDKEEELENLEALNQALVIKGHQTNVELQDARKELIYEMKQYSSQRLIGVKRMGELDCKKFKEIAKRKLYGKDANLRAAELCSLWEGHLRDPSWHPFKVVAGENDPKNIIDDEDERLKKLKHELGDEAYVLVTSALLEMNESPSNTTELWNYKLGKKATLIEGISYVLQMLKRSKSKK